LHVRATFGLSLALCGTISDELLMVYLFDSWNVDQMIDNQKRLLFFELFGQWASKGIRGAIWGSLSEQRGERQVERFVKGGELDLGVGFRVGAVADQAPAPQRTYTYNNQ
jgi:hypothetical protein